MQVNQLPYAGQFRAGHFKEPFTLEEATGENDLTFLERSTADEAFAPAFNTGMMFWNPVFGERATWAAGLFRESNDVGGTDVGDGEYAGTGRVTVLPWYAHEGRCLVHLGAAYSYRSLNDGQALFRARPAVRIGAPNFVSTGPIRADHDQLFGGEFAVVLGPFSVQAEYLSARVSDAVTPAGAADLFFQGYYVQASWFLTGEHRPYNRRLGGFARVRPHENFWLVATGADGAGLGFGRGAWEVAVRCGSVDLNDGGVRGGILYDVTLGLNWYWNPNMKLQWNYVRARREDVGGSAAGTADILAMRFAWDF
jgi:phosphate-selective porin OprO/OprP